MEFGRIIWALGLEVCGTRSSNLWSLKNAAGFRMWSEMCRDEMQSMRVCAGNMSNHTHALTASHNMSVLGPAWTAHLARHFGKSSKSTLLVSWGVMVCCRALWLIIVDCGRLWYIMVYYLLWYIVVYWLEKW